MALFDITIPVGYGTSLVPKAGKKLIAMDDNSYQVYSLSSGEVVVGTIILVFLTETRKDDTMQFYIDNKDLTWQFLNPQDGETFDLEFIDPAPYPMRLQEYDPPRWQIKFSVVGTKQ